METTIEKTNSLAVKLFTEHFSSPADLMDTIQDLDNAAGEYLEHTQNDKLKRSNVVYSINQVKQILWAMQSEILSAGNESISLSK